MRTCMCVCRFCSQLASASEHLVSYLDRSEKHVVATTYKDIHQLVDQVVESGFFDVLNQVSAEPADDAETEPASDDIDQPSEPEPAPEGNGVLALLIAYGAELIANDDDQDDDVGVGDYLLVLFR